jgi:shikimate kinase
MLTRKLSVCGARVMASIAPGAAFAPGGVALRANGAPHGLVCRPLARPALPRVGARTPGARMQEAATDGDAPADVFFSLKQRLQKANVWLIGMDGCGKETIGKELAKKLGYKFMDTNEIIAALLKTPIETAMTTLGEEEFNKVERAVLDQVQAYYGTVVSTGSIAPVFPENWSKFRTGLVAYCKVPHDGLKNEGLQDALSTEAPLISGMPDESRMELLLAQRETKYEQADVSCREALAGLPATSSK